MSANEPRAIVCLDQAWVKLMWVLEYLAEIGPGDLEEIDPDEAEAHQAAIMALRRDLKASEVALFDMYKSLVIKANPAKASDDSSAKRETA
ncbi:MAG: hypothetical protein E6Y34_04775 [Cutibacterium avidum]|uniref:hypothetical protein n=1 Tax=Cutibacterium avidum TaxID=33010 RepID=UPI00080FF982|nr:hypothetical protein [Cutibacterium avidum]MDU4676014.1 hypothetical protein [Cutibacterium avidum]OCK13493.1 hypothetical protein A9G02_11455 [Cutibacterium avidum]